MAIKPRRTKEVPKLNVRKTFRRLHQMSCFQGDISYKAFLRKQ